MIWYGSPYLAHSLTTQKVDVKGYNVTRNGKTFFVEGYQRLAKVARDASRAVGNAAKNASRTVGRATGISQRQRMTNLQREQQTILRGLNDHIAKGGSPEVARMLNRDLHRVTDALTAAKADYAGTPLGKVESWVRTNSGRVMSWLRVAGRTINSGLSAAKNWAVGAGKTVFNAVKSWVKKAFTKTRTVNIKSPQAQLADSAASEYNAWAESNKKPKPRRSNNNNPNSFVPGSDSDLIRNGVFRKK